jgi:hypothetical protein
MAWFIHIASISTSINVTTELVNVSIILPPSRIRCRRANINCFLHLDPSYFEIVTKHTPNLKSGAVTSLAPADSRARERRLRPANSGVARILRLADSGVVRILRLADSGAVRSLPPADSRAPRSFPPATLESEYII